MKSYKIYFALLLFIVASNETAIAQDDPVIGFSSIGLTDTTCIYLRDNGDTRKITLWLVNAVNPSFGSTGARDVRHVAGFELKLDKSLSTEIVSVEYPILATNTGSGQDYIIEYAVPRSVFANQKLILAEFQVAQAAGSEWPDDCQSRENYFIVGPADGATVLGEVTFTDADDPDDPIVIASAGRSYFLAESTPVANESQSWGAIKALYR